MRRLGNKTLNRNLPLILLFLGLFFIIASPNIAAGGGFARASITVTAPNGGETLNAGNVYNIQWSFSGEIESVSIELYKGFNLDSVITSNTECSGSYPWLVPDKSGTDFRIKIESNSGSENDISDRYFSIETPETPSSISVLSPNGGEDFNQGDVVDIRWSYFGAVQYVSIELYNGFTLDSVITSNTACDGSYYWSIPTGQSTGENYKIRIKSITENVYDFSNDYFSIGLQATPQPGVTVLTPNGGENWKQGESKEITWSSTGISFVNIELWIGETIRDRVIVERTSCDGSYIWNIPVDLPLRNDYKILIQDYSSANYDFSNNVFSITLQDIPESSITVISPNGGESWEIGNSYEISWAYTGLISNVNIELWVDSVDLYSKVDDIALETNCDGSYMWTIQSDIASGTDYKILIKDSISLIQDESDDVFIISSQIAPSEFELVRPNKGTLYNGEEYTITWKSDGSFITIDLYKGGAFYSNIKHTIDGRGYNWNIPESLIEGSDYKIKIYYTADPTTSDESDDFFTIQKNLEDYVPRPVYNPNPIGDRISKDISVFTWEGGDNPDVTVDPEPGTVHYHVYLGTSEDELNEITGDDGVTEKSCPAPSLNYGETYYWKVRAINYYGYPLNEDVWEFTVEDSPENQRYIILFPSI
jgi:hypothetical protein